MASRKRPTAASVSDVALYDMTVQEILKKVRATRGVSEKKKVDGKWVSKKKDDMIADLTHLTTSASDSHATYLLAPKDMTYGELRAEVMARPGASEKKKVDGLWIQKTKQDMIADLTMKQNAGRILAFKAYDETPKDARNGEGMTSKEILAKVRATPGLSAQKKVYGKWVLKKKGDMVADLAYLTTPAYKAYYEARKEAQSVAAATAAAMYNRSAVTPISASDLEGMACRENRADEDKKTYKGFIQA